jgi:Xaa-Pro aminopeptidase
MTLLSQVHLASFSQPDGFRAVFRARESPAAAGFFVPVVRPVESHQRSISMTIQPSEFRARVVRTQDLLRQQGLDAAFVYYDELRSANGFYLSNWVPQFESGAVLVPPEGEPAILGGPESEPFAKQDAAIRKTYNVPIFMVPDEEYPSARILSLKEVFGEELRGRALRRLGVVGLGVMPHGLYDEFTKQLPGVELVDITERYEAFRVIKSDAEVEHIRQAFSMAARSLPFMAAQIASGNTELQVGAAGEAAARSFGCTGFGYRTIAAAGVRSGGVVPTPTAKKLVEGELVMFSVAPRFHGYNSSVGDTIAVGGKLAGAGQRLLSDMAHAFEIARAQLKPGRTGKEMDAPVRAFLIDKGYASYMLVPYIHTIGLYEAEGPFFGPRSQDVLRPNMTVCIDISLFGMPELHGARYETGFAIHEDGAEPFAPDIDELILAHK